MLETGRACFNNFIVGVKSYRSVTGILVPVISVLGTNFFVENFGPPGPVFSKIMVRSRNFGPPSHSIVMIYTKGFYLHAIKFNKSEWSICCIRFTVSKCSERLHR